MTDNQVEKDIQDMLKYIDTLEKDNNLLRYDRVQAEKSRQTFEDHSQKVLESIQKQTALFSELVYAVKSLRPIRQVG